MKFKKFLIIFLCVALLAAFSVSCFATSQESYGFYISPGEYFISSAPEPFNIAFSFRFTFYNSDQIYNRFECVLDSDYQYFYRLRDDGNNIVVSTLVGTASTSSSAISFVTDEIRYFEVLDGFYIYDINQFQWWQSNVTRVSPGYNSSFFDNMLSIFTAIGQWISGAAANLTSMFFVDSSLTFVGTLCVASLAVSVVFLIFGLISRFLRFKS